MESLLTRAETGEPGPFRGGAKRLVRRWGRTGGEDWRREGRVSM